MSCGNICRQRKADTRTVSCTGPEPSPGPWLHTAWPTALEAFCTKPHHCAHSGSASLSETTVKHNYNPTTHFHVAISLHHPKPTLRPPAHAGLLGADGLTYSQDSTSESEGASAVCNLPYDFF